MSNCKSKKFGKVMKEFEQGSLHSGSKTGPIVTNSQQAKAIAISVSNKACSDNTNDRKYKLTKPVKRINDGTEKKKKIPHRTNKVKSGETVVKYAKVLTPPWKKQKK